MSKLLSLFLMIIILLAGCSQQETIRASGEGENWKGNVIFEITNSELTDRGGMEYTGDEELLHVTYTIMTGDAEKIGELYPQENQTAISFGTTVVNHPPMKDEAIDTLNSSYINIIWQTDTGKYEEKINLKVE